MLKKKKKTSLETTAFIFKLLNIQDFFFSEKKIICRKALITNYSYFLLFFPLFPQSFFLLPVKFSTHSENKYLVLTFICLNIIQLLFTSHENKLELKMH